MKIIILAHPTFFRSESMIRYARMLADGMKERGHKVEMWMPTARFHKLPVSSLKKWLGYIDQYVIFPQEIRRRLKRCSPDTLFVFTDHALGPWVPIVAKRPHVIHCHDFLAQDSALGKIRENKINWMGKQYQAYIRRGYLHGRYFISVSEKTRNDLHAFARPLFSEVVYNGLNQTFKPLTICKARQDIGAQINCTLSDGYILHVGGNHWYKNRTGVIEIYNAWRAKSNHYLPLLLVGQYPSKNLVEAHDSSAYKKDIHFLINVDDELLRKAYLGAAVFIFPSLAEGFGWPIAEAMASGVPVITTNEAPMTEVAGKAAFLVPRKPIGHTQVAKWADGVASVVNDIVQLPAPKRADIIEKGKVNARRFDTQHALDQIEKIYKRILYPPLLHGTIAHTAKTQKSTSLK